MIGCSHVGDSSVCFGGGKSILVDVPNKISIWQTVLPVHNVPQSTGFIKMELLDFFPHEAKSEVWSFC